MRFRNGSGSEMVLLRVVRYGECDSEILRVRQRSRRYAEGGGHTSGDSRTDEVCGRRPSSISRALANWSSVVSEVHWKVAKLRPKTCEAICARKSAEAGRTLDGETHELDILLERSKVGAVGRQDAVAVGDEAEEHGQLDVVEVVHQLR